MTNKHLPSHPFFTFKSIDKKFYEISILKIENKNIEHTIRDMMNNVLHTKNLDKEQKWLLPKSDVSSFLDAVYKIEHPELNEDNNIPAESDSDSTTDDELIQKALARRMKHETGTTCIKEDKISDSEMEDVLSISRRLRFIMLRLKKIEKQLNIVITSEDMDSI
jgi:hypothetical protein